METSIDFLGGSLDGSSTEVRHPPKVWEVNTMNLPGFYDLVNPGRRRAQVEGGPSMDGHHEGCQLSAPHPDVIERLAVKAQAEVEKTVLDYGDWHPSTAYKAHHGDGERVANGAEPDLSDLMVGDVTAHRR